MLSNGCGKGCACVFVCVCVCVCACVPENKLCKLGCFWSSVANPRWRCNGFLLSWALEPILTLMLSWACSGPRVFLPRCCTQSNLHFDPHGADFSKQFQSGYSFIRCSQTNGIETSTDFLTPRPKYVFPWFCEMKLFPFIGYLYSLNQRIIRHSAAHRVLTRDGTLWKYHVMIIPYTELHHENIPNMLINVRVVEKIEKSFHLMLVLTLLLGIHNVEHLSVFTKKHCR